ncbi:MAG: amidohydrolase family protein [Bacteroidetes bacterium]|nr:amidohydrolase family protein [Bacteroidota bacterium]
MKSTINSKKIVISILITTLSLTSSAQTFSDNVKRFVGFQQESFAITNATLIDGKGTAPQSNMTLIVKGGRITEVGASGKISIPAGIQIIDAKGKTLIPGFVMLHEHIFYTKIFENEFNVVNMTNTFPRMYLAGGVTTMRTAGSVSPHTDLNINRLITEGKMTGPKMDVTGPFIERASDFKIPQLPILPNDQSAGVTVDYWADHGSTSFKVYMHITKNDLTQVVQRAHAHAMKVTGHLCSVTYSEASEIGIDNLEHGFMASSDFVADKQSDLCDAFKQRSSLLSLNKDDERMTNLMKILIQRGITITSTPAVFAPSTDNEMVLGGGEAALHPDILKDLKTRYDRTLGKDSNQRKLFEKELYWIKKFYDMGGKLVIGTDPTGSGRTIAGYSNLWSLEILVKAGFSLPQAVMLCTLKGAEYLKRDKDVGSIEKGKAADFILIDGDLTTNVGNIRKIQWVFKDGIGYDSKTIFESVKGKVGLY